MTGDLASAGALQPCQIADNSRSLQLSLSCLVEEFCERGNRAVLLEWSAEPEVEIACRPDILHPGASLMKLCLVGTILELIEAGRLSGGYQVEASSFTQTRYPALSCVFDRTHLFSIREFCRLVLATSDNPMATCLSDLCTVDDIRVAMCRWGLPPDSFSYVAGYTDEELGPLNRNNRISARSMMRLLKRYTTDPSLSDFAIALANGSRNTRIPALLPSGTRVAHKSGTLNGVANDAGMIELGGDRVWLVVLAEDEPDIGTCDGEIAVLASKVARLITGRDW